jgi:hypothetical protein
MNASDHKPQDDDAGKADTASQPGTQQPTTHSDDHRSAMPERDDKSRKQAPSDRPGKAPGEGEPSVG